jgi:hypothetical protein
MLAMMLAGAAPVPAAAAAEGDEEPDTDAAPVPTAPGTPYQPLVNRPAAKGYSPPYGPPPWGANPLAMALAGGGAPSPSAGQASAGASPPLPPSAPSSPPQGFLASLLGGGAPPTGSRYNPQTGEFLPEGQGAQPSTAPMPAAAAAPAPGAAQNIAGQVSDMGGQNPEQQEIFRARQELRAKEAALTAQMNATSNTELVKVLAAQRQALSGYDQQLQSAYIGTLKPKGHLLSEQERTASGLPTGVYNESAEGAVSPVGGTQEEKDPTMVAEWKAVNEDNAKRGRPEIPLNDFIMQKSMIGKADRPLVDVNGQPVDPNTTGDELLQSLPSAVANHAKAIAEIRERWPSGTEQARQPQLQQALAAAQQIDPSLNQQTYQTRQSMKNAAESGSGRINVANLANNTALFHSNTLSDAIVGLNNSSNTIMNAAINAGAGPTGGIIPGAVDKADAVKQFEVARNAVSNELERSFHGVGTTAEQAVKRQIDDLSVNDAPQTQLGALKAAQDLLRGKIEANEADYRDTMGEKNIAAWERDHGRPFGFITPAAQAAGDRVRAMYDSVKGGKGFHGFEAPSAPSVPTAPGAPQGGAQPVPVKTPEQARSLPKGTPIILPDGRHGVVP